MKTISYTDPRRLAYLADAERELVLSAPQLCATESLARGVQEFYDDSGPGRPHLHALSANLLFSKILPWWYAGSEQVMQYAHATAVIAELRDEQPDWAERLRAFRRNQAEVLQGIRTLAEGGLRPEDLSASNTEEEIFAAVWSRLEEVDPSLQYLRDHLYGRLEDPSVFRSAFSEAWQDSFEKLKLQAPDVNRTLLLHGFYFITPLQKRLFDLLSAAGVDLVFLNCWDERYPEAFATWTQFFPGCRGAADGVAPGRAARRFAEAYRGAASVSRGPLPGLQIRRFADVGAFLQHLDDELDREKEHQPIICSPHADELNQILREYYSQQYKERHFLSYPVGLFLLRLHQVWNEEQGTLELSPAALVDCFASGLLQGTRGGRRLNGRLLVKELHDILPFFEGCRSLEEWTARGNALLQAVTKAVPAFDEELDEMRPENRYHRLLGNPLRLVSYLAVPEDAVRDILVLMTQLASIARRLFAGPAVSLREHMGRLLELIEDADETFFEKEERDLLLEVGRLLRDLESGDESLPIEDLSEAVAYYLGAVEQEPDDRLIKSMESLDGVPLRWLERPLHLCLLTQDALPGRRRLVPWPLSSRSFEKVPDHPAVRLLMLRESEAANASLYLFYYALAFRGSVTLSWVGEWQGEAREESIYLTLLKDTGIREVDFVRQPWTTSSTECRNVLVERRDAPAAAGPVPLHAAAEYAVCPRRFYYSWVASRGPVFRSDFQLGHLYGRLLGWYIDRTGGSSSDARAFIDALFPQWTDVRRQDIAEQWGRHWPPRDTFDGVDYNATLRALLLPGIYGQSQPAGRLFRDEDAAARALEALASEASDEVQMKASPGTHCRYCPHESYCSDTAFARDE